MIPLIASVRYIAGATYVEVGIERVLPIAQGPAPSSNCGDGTHWYARDETSGQASALGGCVFMEDSHTCWAQW